MMEDLHAHLHPSAAPQRGAQHELALAFVTELAIFARLARTYPPSHPMVLGAAEKVLARLSPLTGAGEPFRIGVGRGAFSLAGTELEGRQGALQGYPSLLTSLGIVTLTFLPELSAQELCRFAELTARVRDTIWEEGGIEAVLAAAGVAGIEVQEIDVSELSFSDELNDDWGTERPGLWERLVRILDEQRFPRTPEALLAALQADPVYLASLLDVLARQLDVKTRVLLLRMLGAALLRLLPEGELCAEGEDLLRKMVRFVSHLSPELRRDFLAISSRQLKFKSAVAADPFVALGEEGVMELIDAALVDGGEAQGILLGLMQRLSDSAEEAAAAHPAVQKKMPELLRQAEFQRYVPERYRSTLAALVLDRELPAAHGAELAAARLELEQDDLAAGMMNVMQLIFRILPVGQLGDGMGRQLADVATGFLRTGDFAALQRSCALLKAVSEAEAAAGIHRDGSAVFSHPFVMEVLDAALLFGRERYPQLSELVVSVGEAFVEPLLDRLSLAENRTLRRFYFDCLTELGALVRAPALQRLSDGRWFVLRNLIILLRAFPDLEVQRAVRKFADHPHPRVRSEALKSLIRFHTPGVERLLLRELDSSDRIRQMVAVQLAELTPSRAITQRLIAFLRKSSLGNYDLTLKEAVVATLAAIGGGGVLGELERLLRSHSLLHPGKHRRLQIEILRSLARSPHAAARGLGAKFNIRSLGLPDATASGEREWGTS